VNRKLITHAKSLGEALAGLTADLGIQSRLREYDAVTLWPELVGAHIAKVATAEKISKGILIVRVATSTWRNELQMRKHELMQKINAALKAPIIKDIKFH
jgi:predicted nucleic acid-binding Zn ribbon protein